MASASRAKRTVLSAQKTAPVNSRRMKPQMRYDLNQLSDKACVLLLYSLFEYPVPWSVGFIALEVADALAIP